MRISTSTMYDIGTSQLGSLQSKLARTQQQLATNRRMLTPADDPIASARALEVSQSKSVNSQFATNRANARASLSMVELSLTNVTNAVQEIQSLAVKAGSGIMSAADREALAVELSGNLEDLMGMANASDGNGNYLFAGFKSSTIPFGKTATGAQYIGDQGERQVQVSSGRKMSISDSGSAVFESNKTGNGTFVTAPAAGNSGTGIVSSGTVANTQALTGHKYELNFTSDLMGAMSYSVTDLQTGLPPVGAPISQPFQSGQQIAFDGVSFEIKGMPAAGDKYTVEPSAKQSLFTTVGKLIDTLRAPVGTASERTAMTSSLSKAQENLSHALDNVLSVRASVGSRMKELDTLDSAGEDLDIQYQSSLSQLQDLDVVKAISEFTQQQTQLEAAQMSFKSLSGLSLFNYIS